MISTDQHALDELNRRLMVIRDRVRGVGLRHHTGFYLYGRPGTSKTYTVTKTLDEFGISYFYHKGHLTPMGTFELLEQQHERIIVLDDVAKILSDETALQILLAALGHQPDRNAPRIVRYRRQGKDATIYFTGGIILISNLEFRPTPLLDALKSRVHYLGYDPSDEQLAALMRQIASKGWQSLLSPAECADVTEWVISESSRLAVHLDIRMLVDKAFPDYFQHRLGQAEAHWKDLITATLEARTIELRHTGATSSRHDTKAAEHRLIESIVADFPDPKSRVATWKSRTAKSERAFYRRLKEIGVVTE